MRLEGYTLTSGVTSEPITLADAKAYLRVDFTNDDTLISQLITRCRSYAESITRRPLATQTYQVILGLEPVPVGRISGSVAGLYDPAEYAERLMSSPLGMPPFVLRLPFPPVQSVSLIETQLYPTQSPTWTTYAATDGNGNATYVVENTTMTAQVFFVSVPAATRFRVTMTCGYGGSIAMPDDLKQTILEMIAWRYDNREGEPWPDDVKSDLAHYRIEYF